MAEIPEKILFTRHGPQITNAEINAFESQAGAKLPDDYRTYLASTNGAHPYLHDLNDKSVIVPVRWGSKPAAKDGHSAMIEEMCQIRHESSDPIDLEYCLTAFRGRIPIDTIVIGRDPGGSVFLLCIKGSRKGEILFWRLAYENTERPGGEENVGFVASSFTGFLEAIEPEPDDWDVWEQKHR